MHTHTVNLGQPRQFKLSNGTLFKFEQLGGSLGEIETQPIKSACLLLFAGLQDREGIKTPEDVADLIGENISEVMESLAKALEGVPMIRGKKVDGQGSSVTQSSS